MTEYTTPTYLELRAERDSLLAGLEQAERERKEAAESEARLAQIVVRDKARLASAERERDEWKEILDEARITRDSLKSRIAPVPALVEATRDYQRDADWYRRCLEGIQDRKPVRGLAEAKAAFDSSRDRLDAALTVYEQSQGKP